MKERLKIVCRREVATTAMRFAVIVGPILILINHGDQIFAGSMSQNDWLKSALTMAVPYIVSTLSSVSAYSNCTTNQPD
ncbi:MAG: nitrate/nitrite transporter NrtS [Mariprofundus sp.]|nr:nitrate/nitrite transporter NrtS [Mariprofundus sp.]